MKDLHDEISEYQWAAPLLDRIRMIKFKFPLELIQKCLICLFSRQMAQGRDAAYATASKVMVDNLALRDGQEGIRAFLEKRQPVWSHKTEKAPP